MAHFKNSKINSPFLLLQKGLLTGFFGEYRSRDSLLPQNGPFILPGPFSRSFSDGPLMAIFGSAHSFVVLSNEKAI